ncbi:lipid-binding SYLF domain-containing protein [Solitalea koreensis]|uniref:Las17-binding protein actin regulator n=1 Tax=Solitalea koreensis TaxID=543615 RepID=A0A521CHR3_9SPHI|nr:YSC84-related protein [Solitalea koreensis]SMO58895.1 Las17-binding protein actin regulator [Solitalea koreensis]
MKKYLVTTFAQSIMIFSLLLIATVAVAQSDKEKKIIADCDSAKADFIHTDPLLKNVFEGAYGYVILPNVGKGAVGVGGASGNGIVYEKGKMVGKAKMSQVTVGFQFGGQAYRELIFFENKEALDHFKANKVEFSAQASAVAAKSGASANAKYTNGIMIFTQQKGGVMYEASVGGQKFKYSTF